MTKTIAISKSVSYRDVLDETTNGNFETTLDYLTSSLQGEITSRSAIKILVNCCNACVYKKENVSEELLFKILRNILPYIRDLNENDYLIYLQCMYHFINFFINKSSLETIIQMEEMLTSGFQSSQQSKKHLNDYNNIVTILYNTITKSALNKNQYCNELLFKLSLFMVRMCTKFLDPSATLNWASKCFTSLIYIKIEVQYQIEYYKEVLTLLNNSQLESNQENIFNHIKHFSFVIFNNILSTYDFEKGIEFLNYIMIQMMKQKNQEYLHFHQVLRYFLITKLNNKSLEINKSLESLYKLNKIAEKADCGKGFCQLSDIQRKYYISSPKEWLDYSEELQLQIFKFIIKVNSFLFSARNTHSSYYFFNTILSLIQLYVTHNKSSSLKYHSKCVDMLSTFFEQSEVLKMNKYEHWDRDQSHLAIETNNTGSKLLQQGNKAAQLYFVLIIKYINTKDIHKSLLLKCVESACKSLIEINSKDNAKSLAYISLAIFLCNKKDSFLRQWVNLKYNFREIEAIQKLNLVSALDLLVKDIPEIQLNNSDKTYLLNLELATYKKQWKNKLSILCAMKELIKVSDAENLLNTFVDLFIDTALPNNDEVHDILENILKSHKEAKTTGLKLNVAILYFIYYKSRHKKIITRNAEDMEKVASVIPIKQELNPLENNEYDTTSCLDSLRLEVYIENLHYLELSLSSLNRLVPDLKPDNFEHVKLLQLYTILLEISAEFKLSRFYLKAINALELSLKIAHVLNDASCIIKSIGFIIEQTGMRTESSHKLMKLADELLENKNFNQSENLEVCILYYICKSKALLYHNNYQESHSIFKKAKDLLESVGEKSGLGILRSQLFLLSSKFSMMPCNLEVETHTKSLLINTCFATDIMFEEYRYINSDDSYKISVLIEATEELIKLYHYLKCPKELVGLGREILLLTEKLVIPIHSASFLLYLAHCDLLLDRQDECQVKVKYMANILTIDKMGDETGNIYLKQLSPSSPSLVMDSFQLPFTAQHKSTCDCFYCDCYEYQKLVLEKMRLSALVNVKENRVNLAEEFFQGALKLYEYYSKKPLKNRDFVSEFLSSYGYVLLNYSSHLWRTNCKEQARHLNKKLLDLLENKKLQNVHLYNEVLLQKLGYLTENIIPECVPDLLTDMDNLQLSNTNNLPITPENKQSKVSFMIEHSQFTSPKLKVKKCLPLNFSPTEIVDLTKSMKVCEQTPIPIKIYTETSEKRTRSRIHSSTNQIPKIQIRAATEKKSRQKTNNIVQESITKESSSSHTDQSLKPRTKLLTELLKKKTDSSMDDIENRLQSNTQTGSKRNVTRKNLLKELADSETDQKPVSTGAIRKSRRTKK